MAAIASAANGLWNTGATWTGGVVPTAADTVTITHTVTLDGACGCLTGVVNSPGIVQASQSVSSELRWKGPGNFQFNAGTSLRADLSAFPAITFRIRPQYGSAAEDTNSHLKFMGTAVPSLKGAYRKRVTRVQGAQAVGSSGTRNITVDDATGWQIGDSVFLVSTQTGVLNSNFNSRLTITNITGGPLNAVISVDLAATPIAYSKLDRAYIANESSNVYIKDEAGRSARINVQPGASSLIPALLQDFAFICTFARAYSGDGYVLALIGMSPNQVFAGGGIVNCAFSASAAFGSPMIQESDTYEPFPRIDNVFTNTAVGQNGAMSFTANTTTFALGKVIRPAAFGTVLFSVLSPRAAEVVDGLVGGSLGAATAASEGTVFTRCKFWGTGGDTTNQSQIGVQWNECEFEVEFAGLTGNRFIYSGGTFSDVPFNNCKFAPYGTWMNSNKLNYTAPFKLWFKNKNQDVNKQEAYTLIGTTMPTFFRETTLSLRNRGDASLMIRAAGTAFTPEHWESFVANPSTGYVIKGYCRYDNAAGNANPPRIFSNSPNTTVSGAGVSGNVWTCPAGINTWNYFELTVSHSNAAAINLNLTFDVRSSSATAVKAYFDGVPDYPWVQVARHYGDMFDANAYRTLNPAIDANEATAAAYTGVTVGWGTSASSITLGVSRSFQYVYDSTQYQACQAANMLQIPPWEGIGVAGSLSIFAQGDVTTTGYTLNGGGSLIMGAYTLTATGYSFTGGTFAQESTVPSFSGGTLNIGAAGTYSYGIAGAIIRMTPTAPSTYDLGAGSYSGTLDLRNQAAHAITVLLPGGVAYTTANNTGGAITVSAPVVTQGIAFTGLVAGSQVKVFATGTQTELFSDNSSATAETWSQAGGVDTVVDYTVMKAGYLPVRVVGVTVNAAVVSTPIQQVADRSYTASSGLAYGSTATVTTGTSRFAVTVATTVQNWYSFMVESWIAQAALKNVQFPISSNGPNSFTLDGWEFSSGVNFLKQDGMRYTSGGVATAVWAALYSVDTAPGLQIRYQQTDGGATVNAANTGKIDQLIQVYGDAGHGNFDKRAFLALKVQADGYDQAETSVTGTYGALEDQLYVVGLNPISNGLATGAPAVNGAPTITDHGASPVTWHSKPYSITIQDSAAGNDGETLMRWIRYSLAAGGTFQGKDAFAWHDLVQTNGSGFKTVRGGVYGDTGAALKGVRVLTNAGADHPSFNQHTADDGTSYVPVFPANAAATVLVNSRVQLYNVTTATELDNQFVTGTAYSFTVVAGVSVGDTLRLRVCKLGRMPSEAAGLWTSTGLTFLVSQPEDTVYTTWGVDGSAIPEFSGDVTGHIYIDSNDLDGATTKTRLGAWYSWVLTTGIGITHFYGGVTCLSPVAIRINVDIANILVENTNATTALRFTDTDVRLYRSDGSSVIAPTSYSIHNDYSGVPDYSIVSVGGANVITGDMSTVLAAIPSASSNATQVRAELAPELDQLTKVSKIHGVGVPLVVTATSRTAGDVTQTISTVGATTTVSAA